MMFCFGCSPPAGGSGFRSNLLLHNHAIKGFPLQTWFTELQNKKSEVTLYANEIAHFAFFLCVFAVK
ncbi:MAG: hypothetical protein APF83_02680 [Lutibacter sp. BRH_c52]|nr:MAG: hypothetical protein APF83_02680 [Lutibacter sp. BRH_c52]HCE55718.1 hypothetical protein [Lutibacter sp.]